MDQHIEELIEKLVYLIPTLEKRLIKSLDIGCEPNLSPLQHRAIFILHDEGMLSMSELSKNMSVSKQQLTIIIDKLLKANFVERVYNKNDRRIINVKLSEEGNNFLCLFKTKIVKDMHLRVKALNEDEVNTLLNAIDDIYNITKKLI